MRGFFPAIFLCLLSLGVFVWNRPSYSDMTTLCGGKQPVHGAENNLEIDGHGKFAVEEYNKRHQDSAEHLSFKRVVSAKTQVVAGSMYHLVLEAVHKDEPKLFEAKVWTKPWENFKSLEHFKAVENSNPDPQNTGISVDDPIVKEAAQHAVKGLQQRSNSLLPYELQDIVTAHSEVSDDKTQYHLVMKVKRGVHEEHCEAEVHKMADGKWMVQHANVPQ